MGEKRYKTASVGIGMLEGGKRGLYLCNIEAHRGYVIDP